MNEQLGPVINNLTLAYAPGELSTVNSCGYSNVQSAPNIPSVNTQEIDFRDFNIPPHWSVIDQHMNCDYCGQQYMYDSPQHAGNDLVTGYANMDFKEIYWLSTTASSWVLKPTIAHPPGLTDADPLWKYCTSEFRGVWDPPRVMTPVDEVSPTDPTPTVDPTITPDPGVHISTPVAAQPVSVAVSMNGLPAQTSPPTQPQPTGSGGTVDPQGDPNANTVKPEDPAETVGHSAEAAADPQTAQNASEAPSQVPAHDPSLQNVDPVDPEASPVSSHEAEPGLDLDPIASMPEIVFPGNAGGATAGNGHTANGEHATTLLVLPTTMPWSSVTALLAGTTAHPAGTPQANDPQEANAVDSQGTNGGSSEGTNGGGSEGTNGESSEGTNGGGSQGTNGASSEGTNGGGSQGTSGASSEETNGEDGQGVDIGETQETDAGDAHGTNNDQANSPTAKLPNLITAGGHTFTPVAPGTVIEHGTVLSVGGQPATIQGVEVSMGSNGIHVGSTVVAVPTDGPNPTAGLATIAEASASRIFTAAGATFTAIGSDRVLVGGATLSQGSAVATINGKILSYGPSGLVVGSSKISVPSLPLHTVFTAASQTFTPLADGQIAVDGITLAPGSPAKVIGGKTISLGSSGVVIDSSTVAIPSITPHAVFTAASETYTQLGNNQIAIDGVTLNQGSAATVVNGKTMSYGSSGIVIDSSTFSLPSIPSQTVFTAASETFTPLGNGQVLVDGITLTPGSPATVIDGKTISLELSRIVIDSSTIPLPSASAVTDQLGNIIMSAFGAGSGATQSASSYNGSSSGVTPFTGAASTSRRSETAYIILLGISIGTVLRLLL